jgi:hypothetical protein
MKTLKQMKAELLAEPAVKAEYDALAVGGRAVVRIEA